MILRFVKIIQTISALTNILEVLLPLDFLVEGGGGPQLQYVVKFVCNFYPTIV